MHKFFKKQGKLTICEACCRHCHLDLGQIGYCGVRQNVNGELKLLSYGKIPFLKKEGKKLLVANFGTNMRMSFDTSWEFSLFPFLTSQEIGREKTNEKIQEIGFTFSPKELVAYAKKIGCKQIVFQFNEPLVNIEYVLEVSKLFNVCIVTTGYFSEKSFEQCIKYVKEIHILFFSTFDKFYIKHGDAKLSIIKKNIMEIFKSNVKFKILCPLIPDENNVESICKFLKSVSLDIPVSFLGFVPAYRMLDKGATEEKELHEAVHLAKKFGFRNVDFIVEKLYSKEIIC
jgi:pyruvate formate lyase activating enzyme